MEKYRRILITIMSLLVLSAVIAIIDISMNLQSGGKISFGSPQFGPGIGVVRIEGPIELSNQMGAVGLTANADAVVARLNDLERNGSVKAIVVRINSPGGTPAATQEIYQKIWKLRKKNIPIVASLGEIAASGGYYIASACNVIVSNHSTMTGSIGVIAHTPNLKRLFEKVGIDMTVIKTGRYKDMLAYYKDLTADERAIMQNMIDSTYNRFLKDVALGRNMDQTEIRPIADGRIFDGETALQLKLVDAVGTFEDAVDRARAMAKLSETSPVYDEMKSPFQQLFMGFESMMRGGNVIERSMGSIQQHPYGLEYRWMR
ncbi:MAG: signal peptide peptidase SppA [Spirochaetes bacterium]|jgi:protease-4|nr:signal peptide peptidase SppA [Spirochaetota bacterium]